ncbi:lysostaphin resistance A-like protein [Thermodesulfobacteriota bacterium]
MDNTIYQSNFSDIKTSANKQYPSCHASQNSIENECPHCSNGPADVEVSISIKETLTLKIVALTYLAYIFGNIIISFLAGIYVGFFGSAIGASFEKVKILATSVSTFTQLFFCLILTLYLLIKYNIIFFSDSWKLNLSRNIKIGIKWSIPYIVLFFFTFLIPESRINHKNFYFSLIERSSENITVTIIILTSLMLLVASFLEELIFRGIVQKYLNQHITPGKSVLITASIFMLSHAVLLLRSLIDFKGFVMIFILGLFTGYAYNRSNSCISSFIPHLVFNLRYIIIIPLMLI